MDCAIPQPLGTMGNANYYALPMKNKRRISRKAGCRKRTCGLLHPAAGSAETSSDTKLWRRYRLTHVTVAWQERYGEHWYDYSKKITHEDFLKHYSQVPPAERQS